MPSELTPLIFFAAVLAVFWLVMVRPASKQRREQQQLQRSLAVGDQVVISAGIFGTVRSLDDARARLEVAPGVELEVARQVVVRRVEDLPTGRPEAGELSTDDTAQTSDAPQGSEPGKD